MTGKRLIVEDLYLKSDGLIEKGYGDMHKHCKDLLEEICKELGVEIND